MREASASNDSTGAAESSLSAGLAPTAGSTPTASLTRAAETRQTALAGDAAAPSDAPVVFAFSGDLAAKQIIPALSAMVRMKTLAVPVIGVPLSAMSVEQIQTRLRGSLTDDRNKHASSKDGPARTAARRNATAAGRQALVAADGGWHDPAPAPASDSSAGRRGRRPCASRARRRPDLPYPSCT